MLVEWSIERIFPMTNVSPSLTSQSLLTIEDAHTITANSKSNFSSAFLFLPAEKRLAIKTFIKERSNDLVFEAVSRELKRGGQIYFLHNNVKTINSVYNTVMELFPETKAAIAHGQMRERELEKIMSDFYHRKYHILICTTIIETGIDIPSANTILIDRADKLGLAQLHQIRGRVGRSHAG